MSVYRVEAAAKGQGCEGGESRVAGVWPEGSKAVKVWVSERVGPTHVPLDVELQCIQREREG
jgi:hypothetical protein